ncbi:MAG TPA: aspartate kinase [Dehalococcoidia bacterium]|nr:aspartate kinase [Dehalococcoidia bacterium]
MGIIVQKYGGSSLADAEKIKNVARRVAARKEQGNAMVVVVSAMGKTTDQLIDLAHQLSDAPEDREMDVLMSTGETVSSTLMVMALHAMNHDAISLSGGQAGIRTDKVHRKARILSIDPKRVHRELDEGRIVIVAGFQGLTQGTDSDITTLGRGGSDTTAVALAAALEADACEILTDVEGVYTADPRIVPEARKLDEISYDEMLELASVGAKVMHSRAVEVGGVYNIPMLVASSFKEASGTLIHGGVSVEQYKKVRGIAHDLDVAKVTVRHVPDQPGIAAAIFEPLTEAHVSVDTIVQNASEERLTDLTFTVSRTDLRRALSVIEKTAKQIGAREVVSDEKLGKVSIVGTGMQSAPGYASRMFRTLSSAGINIEMISTSEIRITCIVEEARVKDAVKALHKAFALDTPE